MRSEELHAKFREIRESNNLDDAHRTRLHRAISWLKCAEKHSGNDDDLAVIALWISFKIKQRLFCKFVITPSKAC